MSKKKLRLNRGEKQLLAKLLESEQLVRLAKLHLLVTAHKRRSKQRLSLN